MCTYPFKRFYPLAMIRVWGTTVITCLLYDPTTKLSSRYTSVSVHCQFEVVCNWHSYWFKRVEWQCTADAWSCHEVRIVLKRTLPATGKWHFQTGYFPTRQRWPFVVLLGVRCVRTAPTRRVSF